jgi:hypothetical protein
VELGNVESDNVESEMWSRTIWSRTNCVEPTFKFLKVTKTRKGRTKRSETSWLDAV